MVETPLTPEDRDVLASELALGVLEGADRARALRLMLSDQDFPLAVARWEARLEPLYGGYQPAAPPEGLWAAIDSRISEQQSMQSSAGSSVRQLRFWQVGVLLAGAVAASLALVLLFRSPVPELNAASSVRIAVAQMVGGPDGPTVVARYDPATSKFNLRSRGIVGKGLVPELWVIPADGRPRSLGLIAAGGDSQISVAPDRRDLLTDGATLAVTLEQAATAPHAAPSSAPIAVGKISLI